MLIRLPSSTRLDSLRFAYFVHSIPCNPQADGCLDVGVLAKVVTYNNNTASLTTRRAQRRSLLPWDVKLAGIFVVVTTTCRSCLRPAELKEHVVCWHPAV